jgi:ribosome-associated toxin RatA of RatAB toxin-antitoxin module
MRALAPALAFALLATAARAEPPRFSPEERARIDKGEVLVKTVEAKGDGIAARAAGLIRAPLDRVWAVIDDCGRYSEFMPRTVASARKGADVCKVELSMPFPFSNLWSETRVEHGQLEGGGRQRRWSLVAGTYESMNGSWTLWPMGEGATLAIYAIEADPDIAIPKAILRSAQQSTVPDLFTAVRRRAGDDVTGR